MVNERKDIKEIENIQMTRKNNTKYEKKNIVVYKKIRKGKIMEKYNKKLRTNK